MTHSDASPLPGQACRICGSALRFAFPGLLLADIPVNYTICEGCGSLILPSPHWLERAYNTAPEVDPDFGDLRRCAFIHRTVRRLRALKLLPKRGRCLDFGSGKGILLRMLLDDGQDAWGFDAYATPAFAAERVQKELPEGPFDLITLVEVIEHTLDPIQVLTRLRERLSERGILVLSTELFKEGVHGPEWHYLAPELGQHVTIFSEDGLRTAARAAGLEWAASLDFDHRSFVHLLIHQRRRLSAIGLLRLRWRSYWRERRVKGDRHA
jgi:SAM-dependent methyltransferase